jgi:uncharacterized protein with HEPN domain
VRDESLLLDDVVDAVQRLLDLGARSQVALGADRDRDEAILLNLIVLGASAKRMTPSTRSRFPDVPWTDMAETRDRVVHHYEGVDWAVIEAILAQDLPPLLPRLVAIRDQLRAEFDAGRR